MTVMRKPLDFDSLLLKQGAHDSPSKGLCFMEAVAYVRGLPHTDRPPCVSPAIGAFARSWNDSLNDADRQKLKPYILKVVGTATTPEDEDRRAWLATDWLVRTFTPAWLDLAGLKDHAEKLRALSELSSTELANAAMATINDAAASQAAAWDAAGAAAWDAAGAAARDAAWAAAGAAAWDAARDAAGAAAWDAAGAAARAAARDAAWAAAGDAAWAAAGAALQPTVVALQASAFELLDRMIAVGRTEPVAV